MSLKQKLKKLIGNNYNTNSSSIEVKKNDSIEYRLNKTPKKSENRKFSMIVAEGFVEDKISDITRLLNESDVVFLAKEYLSVNKDCWQDIADVLVDNDFCAEAKVTKGGIELKK